MAVTASSHIGEQVVSPISKSFNVSTRVITEFKSVYNAIAPDKEGRESGQKEEQNIYQAEAGEDVYTYHAVSPELFALVNNYHFKDFLTLALSKDGTALNLIIKENRNERGVSQALPATKKYSNSQRFVSRANGQYENVNWLMYEKPGQLYDECW